MKKLPIIIITILFLVSMAGNGLQFMNSKQMSEQLKKAEQPVSLTFSNANSRDTYFTIHNIAEAHAVSKGQGIKVGIIDWNFGYPEHQELYTDVLDFTSQPNNFTDGHGRWMATVLWEIAPECEIYGLGTSLGGEAGWNESAFVDVMIEAIEWSMENDIDVLTLSLVPISGENRARMDGTVDQAIAQGIVTTFIHYDNPNNILPLGLLAYDESFFPYARKPDINVFQYDYNAIFANQYLDYVKSGPPATYADISNGGYIPFLSFSSMSPVTAGFVAILKSVNNTLPATEYKRILVETSYATHFTGGVADFEDADVEYVVDIGNAVEYLRENYK